MSGLYQDGEFVETCVAPKCGHEMLDESEIDSSGLCVNCSATVAKLPPTLRYDGMFDAELVQFTELDQFSPSYGASFCLPLHQLTIQAITRKRAQVRRKFNEALVKDSSAS
jgi:hypothetical protein